jgi:hypothetical protein
MRAINQFFPKPNNLYFHTLAKTFYMPTRTFDGCPSRMFDISLEHRSCHSPLTFDIPLEHSSCRFPERSKYIYALNAQSRLKNTLTTSVNLIYSPSLYIVR